MFYPYPNYKFPKHNLIPTNNPNPNSHPNSNPNHNPNPNSNTNPNYNPNSNPNPNSNFNHSCMSLSNTLPIIFENLFGIKLNPMIAVE